MSAAAVARCPELGSKPIKLTVKLKPYKDDSEDFTISMQEFYKNGQFTDFRITCADQTFACHRTVLASQSQVFRNQLKQIAAMPTPQSTSDREATITEVRLSEIANPEAVKFMLDFMYKLDDEEWGYYNPRTQEINKDVLRLAQMFELPGLTDRAVTWLAKDLTTGNVVERLTICEDFGLSELQERILEQMTNNRQALAEVANSAQISAHPRIMQAMLRCAAASSPEEERSTPQPKKKGRKA